MLCFEMLCFKMLCSAMLCFVMLCCATRLTYFLQISISIAQQQKPAVLFFTASGPALWQHHQYTSVKGCYARPCRRCQGFWDHQGDPQEQGWVPAAQSGAGGPARAIARRVTRRQQDAGGIGTKNCHLFIVSESPICRNRLPPTPTPPPPIPNTHPQPRASQPASLQAGWIPFAPLPYPIPPPTLLGDDRM